MDFNRVHHALNIILLIISHRVLTSPAFHHKLKKQEKNQEEESGLDHIPFNKTTKLSSDEL